MRAGASIRCAGFVCLVLTVCSVVLSVQVRAETFADLTKDGNAARMVKEHEVLLHTFNLGPTGMRGWIYSDFGSTEVARQILVTLVEDKSPAAGLIEVGDAILGIDGKLFDRDVRMSFAAGIAAAESEKQKGVFKLLVWRNGKELQVDLKLRVMGTYSDTAPYDCPKSSKIFDEGCAYIVKHNDWGRFSLEGLVLLGSGRKEYEDIVKKQVGNTATSAETIDFIKKVEESGDPMGSAWNAGYGTLFWLEYYMATGDKKFLPYIRALAINTARGQGMWGTYGHGFSLRKANGELHGIIPPYGALNQSGMGCFLAMVMARKAGVKHPELDAALERSNKFFGYYTGKGTIPYGEHRPEVWKSNDNNGGSGLAANAFALQGNRREDARFWAKMMTAAYKSLEHGHAGPFFSYLWGTPGAAVGGPKAAAAYFKQIAWHFDLERRWDGGFAYTYTSGAFLDWSRDNRGISPSGAYLLTYALPMRRLCITGRDPDKKLWLDDKEVAEAIESGKFNFEAKTIDELLKLLGNWSPAVRLTAAVELAGRKDDVFARVVKLAEGGDVNACVGACNALGALKDRAVPALPLLIRLLDHKDQWVRVQAAEALKTMGDAARPAIPAMLKAVAVTDEHDPLRFGQGSLCYALFYPGGNVAGSPGLLAKSIEGVDKSLLYPAIKAVSIHPDGHARGCLRSTYELLTLDDVKALMPEIVASIRDTAPCNTMFSKGAMLAGCKMLARLHVEEGIPLSIELLNNYTFHGEGYVAEYIGKVMKTYGGSVKTVLPDWKKKLEPKIAREVIEGIESDQNPAALVSLKEFMKKK
ncbi:MAG: DUF6288 domain-containing protein [bacterium]